MSFKCDVCKVAQPTGVAPVNVVTRVRAKVHHANQSAIPGQEIDREVSACKDCAEKSGLPEVIPMAAMDVAIKDLPAFEGNYQ